MRVHLLLFVRRAVSVYDRSILLRQGESSIVQVVIETISEIYERGPG